MVKLENGIMQPYESEQSRLRKHYIKENKKRSRRNVRHKPYDYSESFAEFLKHKKLKDLLKMIREFK